MFSFYFRCNLSNSMLKLRNRSFISIVFCKTDPVPSHLQRQTAKKRQFSAFPPTPLRPRPRKRKRAKISRWFLPFPARYFPSHLRCRGGHCVWQIANISRFHVQNIFELFLFRHVGSLKNKRLCLGWNFYGSMLQILLQFVFFFSSTFGNQLSRKLSNQNVWYFWLNANGTKFLEDRKSTQFLRKLRFL